MDLGATHKLLIWFVIAVTTVSFFAMIFLGLLDPVTEHQKATQAKVFDIVSKAFLSGFSFFIGALSTMTMAVRRQKG